MAVFHVDASVISKGRSAGGAVGFARYLTGDAERMQHSLAREGHGREDLVAQGAGALPTWARDGAHFFAMADRFERQHGVIARHYQITLPRELSPESRLHLADDLRAAFFERYPHVWAVHCPHARDGSGEQPHLHVMFSTRREDSAEYRTPKDWFSRAAPAGRDPLEGGIRKDQSWDAKRQLQAVRAETAVLINAALEREQVAAAVSHARLDVREFGREGLHYQAEDRAAERQAIICEQAKVQRERHPWENEINRLAWEQQKAREGIRDISREAILDHVRDRFWRQDHSPAREQERQASFLRALERAFARAGRDREAIQRPVQTQEHERSRQSVRRRWQGRGASIEDVTHHGVHIPQAVPEWEQGR
jgi:MobA/MobL family